MTDLAKMRQHSNPAGESGEANFSSLEAGGHEAMLRRKFQSLREQSEALLAAASEDADALDLAMAASGHRSVIEIETLRRMIAAGTGMARAAN